MFCPTCGKQNAPDARFCSACGAVAIPMTAQQPRVSRIVRPRSPRMIAGVCAGVAIHFGWDVALVRILFSVFTILTSGLGILIYLAAWIIIPEAQWALPANIAPYAATYPGAYAEPAQTQTPVEPPFTTPGSAA